jgi:hypothetical protein
MRLFYLTVMAVFSIVMLGIALYFRHIGIVASWWAVGVIAIVVCWHIDRKLPYC